MCLPQRALSSVSQMCGSGIPLPPPKECPQDPGTQLLFHIPATLAAICLESRWRQASRTPAWEPCHSQESSAGGGILSRAVLSSPELFSGDQQRDWDCNWQCLCKVCCFFLPPGIAAPQLLPRTLGKGGLNTRWYRKRGRQRAQMWDLRADAWESRGPVGGRRALSPGCT